MNPYLIIVIILGVAFVGYDMYMSYKRKALLDKLTEHLLKGELQDSPCALQNPEQNYTHLFQF